MGKHIVFVYGTLREHECNHNLLKSADCIARQCWTSGKLLDSHQGYPFLVRSQKSRVYGELYQVDDKLLQVLDQLEEYNGYGKANYYDRVIQEVYTDAKIYQALVYVLPEGAEERGMTEINGGDWCIDRFLK